VCDPVQLQIEPVLMKPETTETIEQVTAVIGTPARYDGVSILLHRVTVGLGVILWTLGQTTDFFPKGAPKIDARSTGAGTSLPAARLGAPQDAAVDEIHA
jgi:hypothetical protein